MNGAIFDSTINVFFKLRYGKVYDAMLATPLGPTDVAVGETGLGPLPRFALRDRIHHHRCGTRAGPFVVGRARAAGGGRDRLLVRRHRARGSDVHAQLAGLRPDPAGAAAMFLFSTTFYPLSIYPNAVQWVVRFSPLYHAIELVRSFTLAPWAQRRS